MAIKLTVGTPSYALYSTEENQYVYFPDGDYGYASVPKASGMYKTYQKALDKHVALLLKLEEWSVNGRSAAEACDHARRVFPNGMLGIKQMNDVDFAILKARRVADEGAIYQKRLEIAREFVYVRIGADIVEGEQDNG